MQKGVTTPRPTVPRQALDCQGARFIHLWSRAGLQGDTYSILEPLPS